MTEERALSTTVNTQLDIVNLGKILATSGYFQDARDAAQAIVKVLAGQELGIGPIAAMTGIYIVKGRVTLSANLIASLVKRSGRYNYRVLRLDNTGCEIEFFQNGASIGKSAFTDEDAKLASLDGDNWRKYKRNMHFSRAMSNGAKWYCPDIFAGAVYTPDELGAIVDGETGEVIEVTSAPANPEPPKSEPPKPANGHRPLAAEKVQHAIRTKAGWQHGTTRTTGEAISVPQLSAMPGLMAKAIVVEGTSQEELDRQRHAVLQYLCGVTHTNELTKAEASAIIAWLKVDGEAWDLNEYARPEMANVLKAVAVASGQQEMAL